jgi:hypothetical protein
MALIPVKNCGAIGVIKDLSVHGLQLEAWTDASNIRFLDGYVYQFLGHGSVYGTPPDAPQYVMQVNVAGVRYWIYASATKVYAVTNTAGAAVYTDLTHATPRAGVVNQWSGFVFGGIPVLNVGDTSKIPMYWDQNLANNFVDLTAWPANTYCKVLRQYKNFMVALNVTKAGTAYPFMMKWSSPAVPGALPSTWDPADATNDAGEFDLAEGQDPIIDGLGLKESFIIYKERSTHRIDYIGGAFIFGNKKVFGMSGILNRNCAVDLEAFHFVVTGSDIVVHDGYTAISILDKKSRRSFFQSIDVSNTGLVFCFRNTFLNEVFVCYPSFGATSCDRALVYNYVDKTVSYRTMPNVSHAADGPVDNTLGGSWAQDSDPWDSDLTAWNGPDFTPDTVRVLMASASTKLYMLDASASFDGVIPSAYLERRGLGFDADDKIKLISGIRLHITGNVGDTVTVKIGYADDPYADPTYPVTMTHTIGSTIQCDCYVSGRYIAIRLETGSAYQWRLDSYSLEVSDGGSW